MQPVIKFVKIAGTRKKKDDGKKVPACEACSVGVVACLACVRIALWASLVALHARALLAVFASHLPFFYIIMINIIIFNF
jgi:hypothetical protein